MIIKRISLLVSIVALGLLSCNNPTSNDEKTTTIPDTISESKAHKMNNLVSIIEIPATDLKRAINFYEAITSLKIEEAEMGEVKMGIFPNEEGTVNVVLAQGVDYKPNPDGSVIYINGGEDLQSMLNKVEKSGGKVIVPKTEISPEMGFFAMFMDTEGNKMGLHSSR